MIPKIRFKEYNDNWIESKLGDFTNVLMCKRIFANQTSDSYEIPFYKIGTIGGKADTFISRELFEEYKNKYNYPKKGEILITCSGTVGKCTIFDGNDSYYQDSNIVWLDNPKNVVDNGFLYYFLSNVDWSKLNSTTITRIYGENLRQLKIIYPESKEEQTKIEKTLSLLDKKIEFQAKKIDNLKVLKNGILNKFFNSDINVEKGLLEDYCTLSTAKSKVDLVNKDGNYYIMDMGTVNSDGYILRNKPTCCTSDMLSYGDLIMPKDDIGGGLIIGKTGFIDENDRYVLGDHVYLLKTHNINSLYLHYQINSRFINRQLKKKVTGSAQLGLKSSNILNQEILIHSQNEQLRIANILKLIDKKISLECDKFSKLCEYKKGLMQDMFV